MNHHCGYWLVAGLAAAGLSASAGNIDLSKLPPASAKTGVTYATDIHPLLQASCVRCHGAERPKAGLRLDSLEGVLKGSKEGKVIVPGSSEKSQLVIAVSQLDPETAMPPKPRRPRRSAPGGGGQPPAGGQVSAAAQAAPTGEPTMAGHTDGQPAPGGQPRKMGPPPKPLTAEDVGLVRAWIDQGAK